MSRLPQPYRQIAIARALASGEAHRSIVRRYAREWGRTERAIYYMIARVLKTWHERPNRTKSEPRNTETLIRVLMLREALKTGAPRGAIATRFAEAWGMRRSSVYDLIARAIGSRPEEIHDELNRARVRLLVGRVRLLESAREAGDHATAAKVFALMVKCQGQR